MKVPLPAFRRGRALGRWFSMHARFLTASSLFLTLLAAAPADAAEEMAFDLLDAVSSDPSRPAGVDALLRGAHGQTRAAIRMKIPAAAEYPVTIPADGALRFGLAVSANAFLVESPHLAIPVRARVLFRAEKGGQDVVLYDREIDLKNRPADRGWFEEEIDLATVTGQTGRLRFETSSQATEDAAGITLAYWSTPRIGLPRAARTSPNLLFVTIDCLRADHVGAWGYPKPTTPNIDALGREGIRFPRTYANAPMTLPSIPQIFTSEIFPDRDQEILTDPIAGAGIPNAAFVNNAWIPLWLSQGQHASPPGTFDRIVSGELDARAISDLAIEWLGQHQDGRFALYLHYLDAHTPYRPPPELLQIFSDPSYQGTVGNTFDDEEGAAAGRYDRADREQILALYDAGIRYVDRELGRVIEELRRTRRLEDTLVVISADHGEEFWDHGSFFHGQSLYDELLHIPLIVRLPGAAQAGTVDERLVRGIDLAPSILDWMGLEVPAGFAGTALAQSEGRSSAQLIATATQAQFPTRFAIRRDNHKVIESLDRRDIEVFQLERDPREQAPEPANSGDEQQLLAALRAARATLRERGFQAEVRAAGPSAVKVVLEGHPRSGTFLTLDRRGETGTALASADGRSLNARGPGTGFGFRFDRLKDPTNLGAKDLVRWRAESAEGTMIPLEIALGRSGRAPDAAVVDLNEAALETRQAPDCAPPETGVRVCLWRFPGEKPGALPEISDPAVRERLRALGYIQ